MNENLNSKVSYENMKKIVKNYYLQQERNVDLRITNEIDTDRFSGTVVTTMELVEKTKIAGVETKVSTVLSINDLKEILNNILEEEGKELVELKSNAFASTRVEGHHMGEHTVKYVSDKSFTITVKPKTKSHTR